MEVGITCTKKTSPQYLIAQRGLIGLRPNIMSEVNGRTRV